MEKSQILQENQLSITLKFDYSTFDITSKLKNTDEIFLNLEENPNNSKNIKNFRYFSANNTKTEQAQLPSESYDKLENCLIFQSRVFDWIQNINQKHAIKIRDKNDFYY